MMGRRERAVARLLLVAVLATAATSLWMAEKHREPYPGLIMPRFAHPGADPDTTQSMTPEITVAFADGSHAVVAPDELVNTPVHAARFVRYNFQRGLDAEGHLRQSGDRADRHVLLNGWDWGTPPRRDVARARDPRTVAWLRERLARLHPDRTPTRITFEWARRTHRIPAGTVIDRELVGTVEVAL